MLEDSLFSSRPSDRSKKPTTLLLSAFVHGTLASALIVIPLFQNQVLPQVSAFEPLHPPVVARGVEVVPVPSARGGAPSKASPQPAALTVPPVTPTWTAKIIQQSTSSPIGYVHNAAPGPGIPGGDPNGNPYGQPNGTGNGPLPGPKPTQEATPPPPPPSPDPVPNIPIRDVRGDLVRSSLIHTVQPVYPRLAVVTHTQGKVILEAVITREGTIDSARLRVLQTASPLLTPAAIEAVQQWRYRPTLLNGKPVEILTTITITFTLN